MAETKQVPYFSPCKSCGKHGHIVYSDDKLESDEFETIPDGLAVLAALVASGKISWDESLEVKLQIETNKLKPERQAVDEYAYFAWIVTHDALERQMFEDCNDRPRNIVRKKSRILN